MEPTLSEIANIKVDEQVATGQPAVVFDTQNLLANLNQAARYKSENDWRKYNTFVNNLKDVYKDLDAINAEEIATQDREYLRTETANVYKELLKDPKNIYNPEFQSKIGKLRADSIESKQNRIFDFAHREYMNRNPELNTDENKQLIEGFWGNPLGKRQAYQLNLPVIFDVEGYSRGLRESVKSPFATSEVTPDNQFIKETQGNIYNRNQFMQRWQQGLDVKEDKYGRPIRSWLNQQFKDLPANLQEQYKTPDNYWMALGEIAFGADKDITEITKEDLQANSGYLKKQELAEAKRWHNMQNALGWERLNKQDEQDNLEANAVWGEVRDAIKKAKTVTVESWKSGGKSGELLEISDPKLTATFTEDNFGVKVRPNKIYFDPEANKLNVIFYKGKSASGKNIIDRERTKELNPTQWFELITRSKNPNKDIGGINSRLEKAFVQSGRDLTKFVDLYDKLTRAGDETKTVKEETVVKPTGKRDGGISTVTIEQKYKAKMSDGSIITSPDGKTWYDSKGNKVQ